ncbi:MAG: endonuclease V [Verrucomicrobia bacterium]|nr:endonuclease V [Verrucomicrobiota bacterium]MBS0637442.1 endonuclease V [Verrucomicrobiota bacterium]
MENWLYPKSIPEARIAQEEMASCVIRRDSFGALKLLGGMDVSNTRFDPQKMIYGSAVVVSENKIISSAREAQKQTFPYVPGYLGFREAPVLVEAFYKLQERPDLIFVDGHGVSHPRGLGVASHIGVVLDLPTIGVAKSILCGEPDGVLGKEAGRRVPLVYKGQVIGMCVRTKRGCKPLYISSGHKISLESAVELVLKACSGYRLVEPVRQAHIAANAFRSLSQSREQDFCLETSTNV